MSSVPMAPAGRMEAAILAATAAASEALLSGAPEEDEDGASPHLLFLSSDDMI